MLLLLISKNISLILYIFGFLINFLFKILKLDIKKTIYLIYFFIWNILMIFFDVENKAFCEGIEDQNQQNQDSENIIDWKYLLGFTIVGGLFLFFYFNYGQNLGFFDRGPTYPLPKELVDAYDKEVVQKHFYRLASYRGSRALAPLVLGNLHGRISILNSSIISSFAKIKIENTSLSHLIHLDWLLLNLKNGYWSDDLSKITGYVPILTLLTKPFEVQFKNVEVILPIYLQEILETFHTIS